MPGEALKGLGQLAWSVGMTRLTSVEGSSLLRMLMFHLQFGRLEARSGCCYASLMLCLMFGGHVQQPLVPIGFGIVNFLLGFCQCSLPA